MINPSVFNQIDELFQKADILMFKERNYVESEKLYRQILDIDSSSIEALNSLANCIKFSNMQNPGLNKQDLFDKLLVIYTQALNIDSDDIESNFNMGLLYLQHKQDFERALSYFLKSV